MAVSNGNLNTVTRTLTKEIRDLNLYSILNPPACCFLLPRIPYNTSWKVCSYAIYARDGIVPVTEQASAPVV